MTNGFENAKGLTRNHRRAGVDDLMPAFVTRPLPNVTAKRQRRGESLDTLPLKKLLANKLLTNLPADDFTHLLPALEPVSFASGERLHKDGVPYVYFPEDAVISHLSMLENGGTTEVAITGSEGLIGLAAIFGSHPPTEWAQVTIAGSALRLRVDIFKHEFARGGELQRLMLDYAGNYLAQVSQRAVCHSHHALQERLCSWLLMVRDRAGVEQLPLTQDRIARRLGVRRAGITTAARNLQDRGIIHYRRGSITLCDQQGLEAAACECYGVFSRARQLL